MEHSSSSKRKTAPTNGSQGPQTKRSKGGSGNKWQTSHHKDKLESLREATLQVGDAGVWVTCQRGKERQARSEMARICEDYGKKLYGIDPPEDAAGDDGEDGEGGGADDIEASIQKELEGMKPSNRPKDPPFETVRSGLDCLFFLRTRPPVDPLELVRQICLDATKPSAAATGGDDDNEGERGSSGKRSAIGISRFVNRFTPIKVLGKATEKGLDEVARKVLAEHFQLAAGEDEAAKEADGDKAAAVGEQDQKSSEEAYSYAIRPTFRAHNQLKRDDVIKKVASLIESRHKVNLSNPDKVILVDIFQTLCGISVVDGDWESLKRYNIHELKICAVGAKTKKKGEEEKAEAAKEAGGPFQGEKDNKDA